MVARSRISRFLLFTAGYAVAAGVVAFFLMQAQHGDRGLETRKSLRVELAKLERELDTLREERQRWDRRVALLRAESLDRDMLEERSRRIVNRVHRDDIVVFDPAFPED